MTYKVQHSQFEKYVTYLLSQMLFGLFLPNVIFSTLHYLFVLFAPYMTEARPAYVGVCILLCSMQHLEEFYFVCKLFIDFNIQDNSNNLILYASNQFCICTERCQEFYAVLLNARLSSKLEAPRLQCFQPQKLGSFKGARFRHAFLRSFKKLKSRFLALFYIFQKKKKNQN